MKKLPAFCFFALVTVIILMPGCNRNKSNADIPDVETIYRIISYMDTLVRSDQVDSIEKINDNIMAALDAYNNRAQSAEDLAVLDSLTSINLVAIDFLQYCSDSRINLELLDQETKTTESQYKSGKLKIGPYINTLLEKEQLLIDISNQYSDRLDRTLEYLKNQSELINMLSPLPDQGN